jgi:uncharacterized protein (DUF2147 family)
MFKRHVLPVILAAMMTAPSNAAAFAAAPAPAGEWLVADGSARIRIQPCDDALWGVIVWATDPGKDKNNPDPALRDRSVIGMPVLLDMEKNGQNRWDGQIYNAENGKTYTANISLVREDVLRVEGCVFGGLFCGGENWTRETAQSDASRSTPSRLIDVCP